MWSGQDKDKVSIRTLRKPVKRSWQNGRSTVNWSFDDECAIYQSLVCGTFITEMTLSF